MESVIQRIKRCQDNIATALILGDRNMYEKEDRELKDAINKLFEEDKTMAKKQPKTEADFTVSISHDDMAKFSNPETVKFTDDTGNMAWGDYTFKITVDNMLNLETLCKYAQMLDFVTHAKGENELNIDGVVNDILNEALSKRVKELAKKHGFADAHDFTETLGDCKDGEDVAIVIRESEKLALERAHDRILMHVPMEDRQKKLFDNAK